MKIAGTYSHWNGLEHILVRRPDLWKEIKAVASAVAPKETRVGKRLYSRGAIRASFESKLAERGWKQERKSGWAKSVFLRNG